MIDINDHMVSIEKFAAFLDGNLPLSEMQQISLQISENQDMQNILDLCDCIDDEIESHIDESWDSPINIESDSFALPDIVDSSDIFSTEIIDPFSIHIDPFLQNVACAACPDNFIEDIQDPEDTLTSLEELSDSYFTNEDSCDETSIGDNNTEPMGDNPLFNDDIF